MTFLPIVERELRVRARWRWTYRRRMLAVVVPLVVVGIGSLGGRSGVGKGMLDVLVVLGMVFCLFEGIRATSDCISEEKREGTLGLLFLTDLRGYDVVLGKFVSASLGSFYGLLATLPVVGLTFLFGGVTAGEFWRSALALVNLLFVSLAVGMVVSVFSRLQSVAMAMTGCGMVAWMGLPMVFGLLGSWKPGLGMLLAASPVQPLQRAASGLGYWASLGVVHALGWVWLGVACVALPRRWQEDGSAVGDGTRVVGARPRRRLAPKAKQALDRLLDRGPWGWLVARSAGGHSLFVALLVLLAAMGTVVGIWGGWPAAMVLVGSGVSLAAWLLTIRVAWCASELSADLKRTGMLELMLITPTRVIDAVDDLGIGFWKCFAVPLFVLAVMQGLVIVGMLIGGGVEAMGLFMGFLPAGPTSLLWVVNLFADFYALVYGGLWFGLKTGRPMQAFVRTLLVVAVGCGVFCCGLRFIGDLIVAAVLRDRLQARMRQFASGDEGATRRERTGLLLPPVIGSSGRRVNP